VTKQLSSISDIGLTECLQYAYNISTRRRRGDVIDQRAAPNVMLGRFITGDCVSCPRLNRAGAVLARAPRIAEGGSSPAVALVR
jgi:hypothetical protein